MLDALDMLIQYLTTHGECFNVLTFNALLKRFKKESTDGMLIRKLTGIQIWASRRTRLQNILEVYNAITQSQEYGEQIFHGNLFSALLTQREDSQYFWNKINELTPKLY